MAKMFKFIKFIFTLFLTILLFVGCNEENNEGKDSKVPVITIKGASSITIIKGSQYRDEGATAHDDIDGVIEVTVSGKVDSSKVGIYSITYTAIDKAGNKSIRKRTVKVIEVAEVMDSEITIDQTPPIITLKGNTLITIEQGTPYKDAGATATDNIDGIVKVTTQGRVDSSKVGTYTLTYSAVDKAGNRATKQRTIKVIPKKIVDQTPPIITLKGSTLITIEQGTSYRDAGATATDNIDGIVKVTTQGRVDSSKVGTYTLTYSAVDKAGNRATKQRTIKVIPKKIIDKTPPIITISGQKSITIEQGTPYRDAGATATDNIDGVVKVTTEGSVNSSKVGSYTLIYRAVDKAGNRATQQRTIKVTPDKTPPVITLIGKSFVKSEQTIEFVDGKYSRKGKQQKIYKDLGATAKDNIDGVVSVVTDGTVDNSTRGTYILTYSAKDKAGNSASAKRTVQVVYDNTPPVITLLGNSYITITLGTTYRDKGVTVVDNRDWAIDTQKEGRVNSSKVGIYIITYSAVDRAGNKSTKTRTVKVIYSLTIPREEIIYAYPILADTTLLDTTPPVITLKGRNPMSIKRNQKYIELGATATDKFDGDIKVKIFGNVNNRKSKNIITYIATDKAGNRATKYRQVNIVGIFRFKTEQITSYKAFDDGYYQRGEEKSFIKDVNSEMITDKTTQLMWQDNIEAQNIKREGIDNYCKNLTIGDYNNWRLPNKEELLSIVNYNKYTPAIYNIFEQVKSDFYWSSTIDIHNINSLWVVNFDDGSTTSYSRKSKNYVRCVRNIL